MRDFALEVHFSRWEFAARHHLTASDAQSMTLTALLALAQPDDRARFEALALGYTETFGSPSLRAAIAGTYESCDADDILCFAGAEEGIYAAMRVMLTPADHAIVVTPNYQAAETIALSICQVTGVPLDPDRGWSLDPERVAAALRPNTRLLSINFPNNPTGTVPGPGVLEALVALCRERGVWLFSDEVYRGVERDPAQQRPQVVDLYERGLSLNVMSKAYGLPGLRIGWIACRDRALLGRLERYKHYLSICNSAPSELLAEIALKARSEILARNLGIIRENLAQLRPFFSEHDALFDWSEPPGGCVSFVRYKGRDGVETFTRRLVEEAGVLLLPASIYRSEVGDVPVDRFRLGFGRLGLEQGLAAWRDWHARNPVS